MVEVQFVQFLHCDHCLFFCVVVSSSSIKISGISCGLVFPWELVVVLFGLLLLVGVDPGGGLSLPGLFPNFKVTCPVSFEFDVVFVLMMFVFSFPFSWTFLGPYIL